MTRTPNQVYHQHVTKKARLPRFEIPTNCIINMLPKKRKTASIRTSKQVHHQHVAIKRKTASIRNPNQLYQHDTKKKLRLPFSTSRNLVDNLSVTTMKTATIRTPNQSDNNPDATRETATVRASHQLYRQPDTTVTLSDCCYDRRVAFKSDIFSLPEPLSGVTRTYFVAMSSFCSIFFFRETYRPGLVCYSAPTAVQFHL